jgi:hypothetical protein
MLVGMFFKNTLDIFLKIEDLRLAPSGVWPAI